MEKRPTCPMCRTPVDLNESGIRVLSYFDIKNAIRLNRPDDAESQSGLSSVMGRGEEESPAGEGGDGTGAEGEGGDGDGQESHMEPPATLRHVVEGPNAPAQTEVPEVGDSASSGVTASPDRGPLPAIPATQMAEVHVNVGNGHQMAPRDMAPDGGSRARTSSHSGNQSRTSGMRRPSRQDSRSRGTSQFMWQQSQEQQHLSRSRRHSEREQQQQQQQQQQHSPKRRPSSSPYPSNQSTSAVASPDTPHAHGKRQSRRRCEICGRRYEGDPRDIVVGYVRGCGHYFHCLCLDSYIRKHATCPRCHYEAKEARKRGQPAQPERRVNLNEVFFAFLLDIVHDADTQEGTSSRLGVATNNRGRQNRGFSTEMQRF